MADSNSNTVWHHATDRRKVRQLVSPEDFIEIYCRCPLEVCEERDVKGLYKRARAGEIKNYTGISAPYEEPENPDLVLDTSVLSLAQSVEQVITLLHQRHIFSLPESSS
jgi:adenylylsulfate kinase